MSDIQDHELSDKEAEDLYRGVSTRPRRGYFVVNYTSADGKGKQEFLWGTKESAGLWMQRHCLGTATVSPISIGVLDSVGVTMQEAGNELHGIIESVLLSHRPMPPLGKRQ